MRVLVLGATGFIGGQIARVACGEGVEVRGLRRRPNAVGAIGDLPVEWYEGDLADPPGLVTAMQGCDVLFHAAAYYPDRDRNIPKAMCRAAREMRAVLGAAGQTKIKRVVYTSSLTTIGLPPPDSTRMADERDVYLPGSVWNAYYEAKWVMEQEALRATLEGLPVVILCPTAIFGPGDVKPTTGRILLAVARGQIPVGIDVQTNFVDVRDVALAHLRAIEHGNPGERYVIGGHNLSIGKALREAAQIAGVRPPRWMLSRETVARLIRLVGWLPLPIPELGRALPYWQPLNSEKGRRTFGYSPRPFTETIQDSIAWFRERGYL